MTGLRDEMLAIRDSYGVLTPDSVVAASTPANAPLHDRFDWDDTVAGPRWRRHQAHELIRSVRVTYREPDGEHGALDIRAFHAVHDDDGTHRFEPHDVVAADPILTELVLRDMRREWQTLHRRYGHFVEFVDLIKSTLTAAP